MSINRNFILSLAFLLRIKCRTIFEYEKVCLRQRNQFATASYTSYSWMYSLLDGANSTFVDARHVCRIIKCFAIVLPKLTGVALTWLLLTAICWRYSSIPSTVKTYESSSQRLLVHFQFGIQFSSLMEEEEERRVWMCSACESWQCFQSMVGGVRNYSCDGYCCDWVDTKLLQCYDVR